MGEENDAAAGRPYGAPADMPVARPWLGEVAATLTLAWPLVLANLAGTALTTMDVLLLGRLGAETLAAAALGTNLFHIFFVTLIGLMSAVSPLVAAEFGRRRHAVREIRRTVRQGLWVATAASVPAMALMWAGEPILLALRQDPGLAAEAGRYLRSLLWALLPNLGFLVLRMFIASLGRPGWGLAIALATLPVNLGLAVLLIFGGAGIPPLGLVGAGVATTLTATLGFATLAAVLLLDRRFRRYHIFGRVWRPDWPRFRAVWRVGLPVAVTLALEVGLFNGSGLMMGALGTPELAAHAIALQIAALCFMVPLGIGQAATIRVGHALGAGDPASAGRAGWAAFALACVFACAVAALLVAVPDGLIAAFIDPARDPEVARIAVVLLAFAALFQLADGSQAVTAGMLRGLQDTRMPMIYAAFGYWAVGAPLGYGLAFPLGFRGAGVWTGLAVGLAVVSGLLLWRWTRRDALGLTRGTGP